MPCFKIQADIFMSLSVFDSPEGSSNTFKTHKNVCLYFKRRYLIIYKYYSPIQSPVTNFTVKNGTEFSKVKQKALSKENLIVDVSGKVHKAL